MRASDVPPAIPSTDWNFDSIPDSQLVACCYWEYARESAFLRAFKSHCVQANRNRRPLPEAFDLCGLDARRVLTIGAVANSFLLGFGFEPGDLQSPAPTPQLGSNAPVTGNFPAPWQSLSAAERDYRAELATGAFPADGQAFQRASGSDAVNALMFLTSTIVSSIPVGSPSLLNEALKAQLAQLNALATPTCPSQPSRRGKPGEGETSAPRPSPPDPHLLPWPTPCLYRIDTHGRFATEIALLQIHWGSFSDDEIIDSFRAWVKTNRPAPARPLPARGHKLKDWRANLTRLAVMRLLTRFSALQLLDPKANHVPGLWESKQFSGPTWLDVVKWHDARREARALFHQLFPFLPPADDPNHPLPLCSPSQRST